VLEIVVASVAIGSVIGLIYGLIAGMSEKWISTVLARFVDMMLSIPGVVLAILIAFLLRPGLGTSIVVISVVTWPGLARLVRGEVLRVRNSQYVELGVTAGLGRMRLAAYHIVPNIMNTFVAFLVLDMAFAIQLEAGLSFLGFGIQQPTPELGSMLATSLTYLNQWWLALFPGLVLTLLILAVTYVGQDVRDRLDPRLATRWRTGVVVDSDKSPSAPDQDIEGVRGVESPVVLDGTMSSLPGGGRKSALPDMALCMRNVTVEATGTGRRVVDDVSFEVRKGGVLAIVGESGSGKSSVCLAALGLLSGGLRTTAGAVESGGVSIDLSERSAPKKLRRLRGRIIGLVLQDPSSSLDPLRKVGFQLQEARRAHGLAGGRGSRGRRERRSWELEKLESLGFVKPVRIAASHPSALSGGMRQRVCVGIASSADPEVIIADEPTTALDASLRGRVLRLLLEMCRQQETALVFVTHDLSIVKSVAEKVAVMYGGMVLEEGTTVGVFTEPRSPYTQALLAAALSLDQTEHGVDVPAVYEGGTEATPQHGCPFVGRCRLADDVCSAERPSLEPVSSTHRVACWHAADTISAALGSVERAD
jgi:peptide/nickel transport system permease protein